MGFLVVVCDRTLVFFYLSSINGKTRDTALFAASVVLCDQRPYFLGTDASGRTVERWESKHPPGVTMEDASWNIFGLPSFNCYFDICFFFY